MALGVPILKHFRVKPLFMEGYNIYSAYINKIHVQDNLP